MTQLLDLLGTHWLALVLLVGGAVCGLLAAVRRRHVPLLVTVALGCGAFALGSMFLGGLKFSLSAGGDKWSVGGAGMLFGLAMMYGLVMLVLTFRAWNPYVSGIHGFIAVLGFGGWLGRPLAEFLVESAKSVIYTRFVSPWWLLLLVLAPLVYVIGRKSLSGLGPVRRWVAIGARSLVVALLALALAEPRVQRPSENMAVIFVVDRSASVPRELADETGTGARDKRWVRIQELIESSVSERYKVNRGDQFGVLLFGKRPKLAFPPTPVLGLKGKIDETGVTLDENYTDIGAAIKLALASFPEGTGKRVVLVSDGNQNLGNAEEQADLAKKNGVVIDAIALAPNSKNESDVLVQSVDAPPVAATGARLPIRVNVRNASPNREVTGKLELVRVGGQGGDQPEDKPVDIEIDDGPDVVQKFVEQGRLLIPARVRLKPGLNVFKFRDREQARADSSYTYRAKFIPEPGQAIGDRIANNTADAAVVARGSRRVLFLSQNNADEKSKHKFLLDQLAKAKILCAEKSADALPKGKTDLGVYLSNFDCLILANVPYDDFTEDQAEVIRTQVYDQGCGLIMLGGPDSFGPGGYQQTPIEAALPVECEIKAKKAMGKGGLVLIMHASEMADGNKWQKEMAKLAIQRLNASDMVGVVDYGFLGGQVNWQLPFEVIGDRKQELYGKVDKMNPGDMPDFDPFLQAAADTLSDPKHNLTVKHCILISDGDPNFSNQAALKKMTDNGITCTTIGVATHGVNEDTKMKLIANSTKDANGNPGNFHKPATGKDLPAIYIKETRKISQSFLFDREFKPELRLKGPPTDGLTKEIPSLYGFVRTTNKQSPTQNMWIEGPKDAQAPEQEFPILATWRYGLGKSVAFTSDARDDAKGWGRAWAREGLSQKFWENVINWAMREAESGELAVTTRYVDGKVRVVVTAENQMKDKNGRPLPLAGMTLRGGVSTPNKPLPGDKVPTVTFKPNKSGYYEAEFDATEAGAYFLNVQAEADELDSNGKPVMVQQTKDGKPVVDKDGKPVMVPKRRTFAARAGVTVPYSPEFIDLESNTALMKRLAEATGGEYFDEPNDPAALVRAHDFYRLGPTVVRSVLPFWFWLVFAAGVLLFLDVGVRRISLEFKEVRHGARKLWAKLRRNEDLPDDEDGVLSKLGKRKQATAVVMAKRATKKFEATGDLPDDAAPAGADDYAASADKKGGALPPPPPPRGSTKTEEDNDDFMSRMRKAKQRGQQKQDGE